MKIARKILKWVLLFLLIPTIYILTSFLLTAITIDRVAEQAIDDRSIFLNTNGVHLDIVIRRNELDSLVLAGLTQFPNEKYFSIGWGDENFYINTPTWAELTFQNAFKAMFLKSSTLIHVTRYRQKRLDWVEVKINKPELAKLNAFILQGFALDEHGKKIILPNKGYSESDNFYKANGNYSCLKTCNSWVNKGFKESGLRACLWTPFDFGLLGKYE